MTLPLSLFEVTLMLQNWLHIHFELVKQNWCLETWIQKAGCWQKKSSAVASYSQPTSLLTCPLISGVSVAAQLKKKRFFQRPLHHTHTHRYSDCGASLSISPSEHDECASGQNLCDENAICTNTIRGHLCTCKPGYVGNGTICRGKFLPWNSPPDTQTHTNTDPNLPPHPLMVADPLLCNIMVWFTPPSHHLTRQQLPQRWWKLILDHQPAFPLPAVHPVPCWPVALPRPFVWLAL